MGITGREFEALADHAGPAYLRYSFTKGTEQEVRFLVERLGLRAGDRVLDVGCGPGRHALALRRYGVEVVGLDISWRFLVEARGSGDPAEPGPAAPEPDPAEPEPAEPEPAAGGWVRGDARRLPVRPGSFDAAISLCQGGFGLLGGGDDPGVLTQMAEAVRPGGRVGLSAFSAYFALRYLEEGDTFDAATGVNHERAEVLSPAGEKAAFDLWTTCFTPRELRLMADRAGIEVDAIWSVAPGEYAERKPDLQHPEFLLVGGV